MERILIVEDDASYREFLYKITAEQGYEVDCVDNPISGIENLAKKEYDLILSDLRMQEMDGVRFVKMAKAIQNNIRSIILTADPDDDSEMAAIDSHVDLYMVKEKGLHVILKYIRVVLEREKSLDDKQRTLQSAINHIKVDQKKHQVYKQDKLIELTHKEYELLLLLLKNKNIAMSREDMISAIWSVSLENVDPRIIDVHIKNLRNKLRTFSIITIRGYGYKWHE